MHVFVHDDVSGTANGSQVAHVLTTTDLATLTDQGEIYDWGHHTGYGQYWWDTTNSQFVGFHNLSSGQPYRARAAPSTACSSWCRPKPTGVGNGKLNGGVPFLFQWQSQW